MEDKTLKYWDLVKYIHPDWNPDIEDPEVKMEEATANKDDGEKLYRLAVQWGFIKDDSIPKFELVYDIMEGYTIKIDKKESGIIVNVKKLRDCIHITVFHENKFFTYKRKNIEDQDENFYISGIANSDKYMEADFKFLNTFEGKKQQSGDIEHKEYDPPNRV